MITFKCKNCGGEMFVSRSGDLSCPYCGTKGAFSDSQLREYKEFRMRMLEYLRAVADSENTDRDTEAIWESAEEVLFDTVDGDEIAIRYIYRSESDGITMYCARNNVIYCYPKNKLDKYEKAKASFASLTYPAADMKHLDKCFPKYAGSYSLKNGGVILVLSKPEDLYPVGMFGKLIPEHVEWIISRLENIACVLEFNEMSHKGISVESVFINPKTHEAALLGDWQDAIKLNSSKRDLQDIRKTAIKLLGDEFSKAPSPLKKFLNSMPEEDAFKDFEKWDNVIEKELGGRHFTKFKM